MREETPKKQAPPKKRPSCLSERGDVQDENASGVVCVEEEGSGVEVVAGAMAKAIRFLVAACYGLCIW
jgi:hypothetical protein